jgi:alkylation response protein AidB-like acyl-CoA dehydrogenase
MADGIRRPRSRCLRLARPPHAEVGREYLLSRAATMAVGTTEVMRNILAERVLGLPKG